MDRAVKEIILLAGCAGGSLANLSVLLGSFSVLYRYGLRDDVARAVRFK